MLIRDYAGRVPDSMEELMKLPGVGRKVAGCVLVYAFRKPAIPVDTHVFRVANRIGFVDEANVLDTELALLQAIPKKWQNHAHHWMILHGRYICQARQPKCGECLVREFCQFENKVLRK